MEITQKDRDALRLAQQRKAQPFVIGSLVEHRIQDPAKYKILSRQEQGLDPKSTLELPRVNYESIYYDNDETTSKIDEPNAKEINESQPLSTICESDKDLDLPISPQDVQSNLWLNMDRVEFDKLEWMSDKAERAYRDKLQSTTHFDSEGRPVQQEVLLERQEKDKRYATGDSEKSQELDLRNQVHDIDGIVKLLDSQFQPQVTYALTVISKIAVLATTGYYDSTFSENIHEILLKECLLRVRRHLDSTNETICQNALKCLRALLCNAQIDEIFLDRMHPILSEKMNETLWLNDEKKAAEFDIDTKDNLCVQLDAILALVVRTNLMSRLEYLIKTKQGQFVNNYNDCILDIFIRMARHSRGVCAVLSDAGLLDLVVDRYLLIDIVRSNEFTQSLAIRAMKFVRIIAQASMELNRKHKGAGKINISNTVLKRVESYYYIDLVGSDVTKNNSLLKLHIEALRLMKTLSLIKDFTGHIHSIVTMSQSQLMKNFQSIGKNLKSVQIVESRIALDWQFAAHTIDLVGYLMHYEIYQMKNSAIQTLWSNFVKPITLSWLNDLIREKYIPHLDISIAIASAVFHAAKCLSDDDNRLAINVFLKTTIAVKEPKENASLAYFNILVRETEKRSQLKDILQRDGRLRDPKMLSSYGCLDYNSTTSNNYRLNPVVENDSPLILLEVFSSTLLHNRSSYKELIREYVNNLNTVRYLRCASRYFGFRKDYESFVQRSILAQQEIQVMIPLILLQVDYYMERRRDDDSYNFRGDPEPYEIATTRKESYSNLMLSAISVIGLVNPQTDHLVTLKDKLLESAVLNNDLHTRLARENYKAGPKIEEFDLAYYNRFGLDKIGERTYMILEEEDTQVLKPLYMSVEQPGRFWIFEPLIEYYSCQLKESPKDRKAMDGRFFANGISGQLGFSTPYEDHDVVACILRLHAAIMHTSPAYNRCVLRTNIEEFLCLIGTVFLDDNLFLLPKISESLNMNLEILVAECIEDRSIFTDASRIIETLDLPLNDFFNKLVDQYESCSYGDPVFTNFLLLFITANSDKSFKKKLFSEKVETCIGQMRLPLERVWASSSLLFDQIEKDSEIKELISRAGRHIQPGSFMQTYRRTQMKHY